MVPCHDSLPVLNSLTRAPQQQATAVGQFQFGRLGGLAACPCKFLELGRAKAHNSNAAGRNARCSSEPAEDPIVATLDALVQGLALRAPERNIEVRFAGNRSCHCRQGRPPCDEAGDGSISATMRDASPERRQVLAPRVMHLNRIGFGRRQLLADPPVRPDTRLPDRAMHARRWLPPARAARLIAASAAHNDNWKHGLSSPAGRLAREAASATQLGGAKGDVRGVLLRHWQDGDSPLAGRFRWEPTGPAKRCGSCGFAH